MSVVECTPTVDQRRKHEQNANPKRGTWTVLRATGLPLLAILAACGEESEGPEAEIANLRERVQAVEAVVNGLVFGDDSGAGGESLGARVAALEQRNQALEDEVALLGDVVESLEFGGGAGGVWTGEGEGTGTCARVNVITESVAPLVVLGTVAVSTTASTALCEASGGNGTCTYYGESSTDSAGGSALVTLSVENVGGQTLSVVDESRADFLDAGQVSGASSSGAYRLLRSATLSRNEPLVRVIEIPSPGSYTVELRVTGESTIGVCRLVVMQ